MLFRSINGKDFDFSSVKGKKILLVNTASDCGFTGQYEALEKLQEKYSSSLIVIGFPANDFKEQESKDNESIATFCKKNYGVSFPMMSKISVKGEDQHELYRFLTTKAENGLEDNEVKWNFQKYLIDENGKLIRVIQPRMLPDDPSIIEWITK